VLSLIPRLSFARIVFLAERTDTPGHPKRDVHSAGFCIFRIEFRSAPPSRRMRKRGKRVAHFSIFSCPRQQSLASLLKGFLFGRLVGRKMIEMMDGRL